jgi:catechol 2,3-dioxygenase-like lactoylglutathione lyase family enzyme
MATLTRMVGFLNCTDAEETKRFFGDVLGFRLLGDDDFAIVFDANGTMLRINKAQQFTPQQGTVLGWQVDDIHAAVRELTARGVRFEQWNLPFLQQDEQGVWSVGNGDQVAWFKDPAGNVLSISHHAASAAP